MIQKRKCVIFVWIVGPGIAIDLIVIEGEDVCVIEHNVFVWGDYNMRLYNNVIDLWIGKHPEITLTDEQNNTLHILIKEYGNVKYDDGYSNACEDC